MELFRLLFFLLHASLFVLIWVALVASWRKWPKFAVYAVTAVYLVYLAWFQRGIEERYTLPVLPVLLIAATDVAVLIVERLKNKKVNFRFPVSNH